MIKLDEIKESINTYADEVLTLSVEARNYLNSFKWCGKILNGWLVKDWGYMLCLFYFEIDPIPESGADNFIWIIVGDVPPAYIDIVSAKNELEALEVYVDLMEEWIDNAKRGKSVKDCFPINVEPSKKYANMLFNRIKIIKNDFIPEFINICDTSNA